ncbi:MAG: tRNA pseudouridine(54/55) synthase Pus10, partial [Candidatus Hodarchaeota archaeon]
MGKKEENAILRTARGILEKYTVCDQCLGRQFAWLSTDTSNEERGNAIKLALSMTADHYLKSGSADEGKALLRILAGHGMFQPAQSLASRQALEFSSQNECHLCQHKGTSVFERIPSIAETTEKLVKGVEFNSFLVGCVPDPLLSERQDELRAEFGLLHGEALKADFNRELGKHLQTTLGKQVDFASPDLVILYNMERDSVKLNINPAFVYGKYRKLARGIPQSRWDCKECRGKGCEECGGTGRRYQDSISEYIGEPVKESMRGSKFKFHAAGREDIDVLMLGSGRPFV